jgi:hypothetical protein
MLSLSSLLRLSQSTSSISPSSVANLILDLSSIPLDFRREVRKSSSFPSSGSGVSVLSGSFGSGFSSS